MEFEDTPDGIRPRAAAEGIVGDLSVMQDKDWMTFRLQGKHGRKVRRICTVLLLLLRYSELHRAWCSGRGRQGGVAPGRHGVGALKHVRCGGIVSGCCLVTC